MLPGSGALPIITSINRTVNRPEVTKENSDLSRCNKTPIVTYIFRYIGVTQFKEQGTFLGDQKY